MAAALGSFWRLRSSHAEGRQWLETFLARPEIDTAPAAERVAALRWAGELAGLQGDLEAAKARLAASLALARRSCDRAGIAAALTATASALLQAGDVASSIAPFEEAAALTRELGNPRQTAFLLAYLAFAVGHRGDLARAETLLAESEELLRALGDTHSFEANLAMLSRGWLALMAGAHERALHSLTAARDLGEALAASSGLSITLARGQFAEAAEFYREGLRQARDSDFPAGAVFNLQGIVRVGSFRGEPAPTARLVAALGAFGTGLNVLPRAVIAPYEAAVAKIRAALGEQAFAAARAAGQALPLSEVDAEAMTLARDFTLQSEAARAVPSMDAAQPGSALGLTTREVEVLRLLVAGKSNPEIGEALFISPRTAQTHVTNILGKLGVATRTEAAARAVRDGLV